MVATIDISLYPLSDDFRDTIRTFIQQLRKENRIQVVTDGMSTKITGEYSDLMHILDTEMIKVLKSGRAAFVLKVAGGNRLNTTLFDTSTK